VKLLTKSAIFLTVCLALATPSDLIARDPDKPRDLRMYERAGPYVFSTKANANEDGFLMAASVRDFLWRHWHDHRRGLLLTITFTIEGLPNRTSYFVEPDGYGKWQIATESKTALMGADPTSIDHPAQTESSTAYFVERMDNGLAGTGPKAIPANEMRDAMSFRLILKNREGKVTEEI
jgi:hypothetical protein